MDRRDHAVDFPFQSNPITERPVALQKDGWQAASCAKPIEGIEDGAGHRVRMGVVVERVDERAAGNVHVRDVL